MGWNPINDMKKLFNKFKDEVNSGLSKVRRGVGDGLHEISQVKDSAINQVKEVENKAKKGISDLGHDIEDKANEAKSVLESIPEKAEEEVEKVLEKLSEEISAEGIKKSLETAADVIELISPDKFTLILGIELALVVQGEITVSVGFPNPLAKLTEIRGWAKHPPKGRSKIIECVKDFGPDSISVEAKISGNGMSAEWSGEDKYDKLDKFLEKHGV